MYIEEIILEGFKSYASRTVISGWDPSFNAITGLNGSGKSNILDAICFVLGITNLSQVRVGNLQELVYKVGQAGVTKASVTIVFNNDTPKQSPVGYEGYKKITVTRQVRNGRNMTFAKVVIGGRNKYLINGINANGLRVQNLFHSVQLNVNNPHFLIMQGKITRVINMKPPEILAMIEEAAGTRMFEMKKHTALKTIEKKDRKVEEISKILETEINPTLEKLRQERTLFTKWTNNTRDIERLSRFVTAFEYCRAQQTLQTSENEVEGMEEEQATLKQRAKQIAAELDQIKEKIADLSAQKEKEMESDFKKLEATVNKLSKEFVKANSEWQHLKETYDAEESHNKDLNKSLQEAKESIELKSKEIQEKNKGFEKQEHKFSELQAAVDEWQRKFQAASVGMSADAEGEKTLAEQLMDAKREAVNAATEHKQAQMMIKHLTVELKEHKKSAQAVGKEYTKLQADYEALSRTVEQLRKQLEATNFDEKKEQELLAIKKREEQQLAQLKDEVDKQNSQLPAELRFVYSDPEPNFDRSKVKGLVAKLISVNDPGATMALEVTAGGKLYNVVVDSEVTGKKLISKGQLKRRVTIIPLNKISARTIDPKVIKFAESLVGTENVKPALSMVEYDKDVDPAMKFVFGNTFICQDSTTAKQVTFHQNIRTRSVTLEGDLFDPAGTLTGGSRASASSTLLQLQNLSDTSGELKEHEGALTTVVQELAKLRKGADQYKTIKQQYEVKLHELELLQATISQNPHHQLLEKVKELEAKLETANDALTQTKEREAKANKDAEKMESQMKNYSSYKESQMKEIETNLSAAKSKFQSASKEFKKRQQEVESITLEIEEAHTEVKGLQEQIKASDATLLKTSKEVDVKDREQAEKRTAFKAAELQLETKRKSLAACDKSITDLIAKRDAISKEETDIDIQMKKIEGKLLRYHKDKKDAAQYIVNMENKHSWIATDKHNFGKSHTEYDFKAESPEKAQKELTHLQDEQSKLAKQINKKVMSMYEKAENEYKALVEKKSIIESDKASIKSFIKELEDKKNEALTKTWEKVNRDFGSIFSTLLPGTNAKLEPPGGSPEGKSVLDGLEMKVAFGDVWKNSLSELSGGQRSLLALSLILALLLFKPAPMYILDEVDAALDLNHTQNIGQMLKTHFSHSQFIVVSLKEDMFKNANVLFQTKFVDGISQVTRTTNTSHKTKK